MDINLLQCLGEGALSRLEGIRDSVQAVGRFLRLIVTDPGAARQEVSDRFHETIDFVMNIKQEILAAREAIGNLPTEMKAIILCQAVGQVIAQVGIGVLRSGLAGAISQSVGSVQEIVGVIRQQAERFASLAAERLNGEELAERIRRLLNGEGDGNDADAVGGNEEVVAAAGVNGEATPVMAVRGPDNDLPESMDPENMPRSIDGFSLDDDFVNSRLVELGLARNSSGALIITNPDTELGQLLTELRDVHGLRLESRPNSRSRDLFSEDGAVVLGEDLLSRPRLVLTRLRAAAVRFRSNSEYRERLGFELSEDGVASVVNLGSQNPRLALMMDRLQNREDRQGNSMGVEIVFSDRIGEDVLAEATGDRRITFHPSLLAPGREGELRSVFHHEVTHITTVNRNNAYLAAFRRGEFTGQAVAAARGYVGRAIQFETTSRPMGAPSGYSNYFRGDEVEARVRQMPLLDRDTQDWRYRRQTALLFIESQRTMLDQALDRLGSAVQRNGDYRISLDGGQSITIDVELLRGTGLPDHELIEQVIEQRMRQLSVYALRMENL